MSAVSRISTLSRSLIYSLRFPSRNRLFISKTSCRHTHTGLRLRFLAVSPPPEDRHREKRAKMTRGNQRDLAREKNQKKMAEQKKRQGAAGQEGNAGLSMDSRMNRDADIMRIKQEKAAAKKAEEAAAASANAKKVAKVDPLKM
ncbi:hypothetical protein B9Z55_000478 [Caenorhabditis nigoni]|uniref:Small EDRK-rich factor-like N-terminal domain-containing protein n=1 Tax=Caenorhabditis nigoni TaxID=1611254 RepID=A0A2G5VU05_9PELO|nr:hypothetical protein B9Z55_000478 [Caenorhabditis nigoni]